MGSGKHVLDQGLMATSGEYEWLDSLVVKALDWGLSRREFEPGHHAIE